HGEILTILSELGGTEGGEGCSCEGENCCAISCFWGCCAAACKGDANCDCSWGSPECSCVDMLLEIGSASSTST
ncbi:MAG TPA: hypothetical protein VNX21_07720, partial [Candidatus Thermoplasmatota archaeon]|nr:hypothetical protein [Candidatus Thermoplasmatota archaeon]